MSGASGDWGLRLRTFDTDESIDHPGLYADSIAIPVIEGRSYLVGALVSSNGAEGQFTAICTSRDDDQTGWFGVDFDTADVTMVDHTFSFEVPAETESCRIRLRLRDADSIAYVDRLRFELE